MARMMTRTMAAWVWMMALGLVAAAGCSKKEVDPVAQVEAQIAALEAAVEAGDLDAVDEIVADSYSDPRRNDKGKLIGMLQVRLLQRRSVHVLSRIGEVRITEGGSEAAADVLAAVGSVPIAGIEALARLKADVFRLRLNFERDGDEWRLRSAVWSRAGRDAFDAP